MALSATTTQAVAIETRALSKRHRDVEALSGVDLTVPRGLCFGLLGPNGAGKTTLVSILATLARPTSGSARVLGHDVAREGAAVRRSLGIVFQEPSLDLALTAREHLDLQCRWYRLDARASRVAEALAAAGLADAADRPVRGLSGGMKRRLEIARGMLHRPALLFLDEPTLGLDVQARGGVWDRVRALIAAGDTTVFLTTHSMDEAAALCARVAILDRGRLVVEGCPADLVARLGGDAVLLRLGDAAGALAALAAVDGVASAAIDPGQEAEAARTVRVIVAEGPRRLPALLDAARPFGVLEVSLERPTLAHVFLHHTGHPFEPAVVDAPAAAGRGQGRRS
jgi:ABC-2 type transport system ATP-binding protein